MYTGKRHRDCIAQFKVQFGTKPPVQGFVTTNGMFVDRKKAAQIALKSGQVKKLMCPPELFSEDLY
jgi:hypothetical protein